MTEKMNIIIMWGHPVHTMGAGVKPLSLISPISLSSCFQLILIFSFSR